MVAQGKEEGTRGGRKTEELPQGVLVAERLFANEAIKICIIPMP